VSGTRRGFGSPARTQILTLPAIRWTDKKMKTALRLIFLNLISVLATGQTYTLKSTAHGLDMMLRHVPKEQLIEEIRFEDGPDNKVDVIRLDHVGPNLYPLLISSKLPVATDSLGLLSFKLQKDTLDNFLWMIDHVNPKMQNRNRDFVLIRVTYKYEGRLEQYHITNAKITTGFFMMIENKLIANKDSEALDKFYRFIAETRLLVGVKGKRTWKYLK
jgi:hypothetical protein